MNVLTQQFLVVRNLSDQAAGETTTTHYNDLGQVASVVDPKGTTTYTYDGTDAAGNAEHRGLATKVETTRAGGTDLVITGAYDASGALVTQKLPGQITQQVTYDPAGEPTALSYTGQVATTDVNPLFHSEGEGAGPSVSRWMRNGLTRQDVTSVWASAVWRG